MRHRGFIRSLMILLGTGFGAGFAPFAPGTWGSLVGVILAGMSHGSLGEWFPCLAILVVGASFPISGYLGRLWESKDPQRVVLDEIAALFLMQCFFPVTLASLCGQFLWFRVFDILKPFPARQGERLPGGYGIVADDLLAGIYATGAVWGTHWLLPLW